jgi:tetratricopeptide (TPR) repeat protein
VLQQRRTERLIAVLRILRAAVIALLILATTTAGQSVQTIDSETQLAATLCRNPTEETASEPLLKQNAEFVNVTLWNALLNCALSAPHRQSPTKSIAIFKLMLRVADRVNKRELVAITHYHLGRTYSLTSDFENSIQAYETSRELFEQEGFESNLIFVLADLGALYFTADDYEKAKYYSEQSLAIAGQLKSASAQESLGPIESGQARSLHTLGQIDLIRGSHHEALNKLREALALLERINNTGSSYSIQIADVLIALSKVYGEMGEYGRAFSYLTRAHQVSRSSGDQNTLANIMSNQASLFLEQEDYAAAQKYFNASLAIYGSLANTREEARVLLNLAIIEQRNGRNDDARWLLERTMERAKTAKLVDVQIVAGAGLGVVLTAKRDLSNALQAINDSLELARLVNAKTREAELLWRAAQTYYVMQNYRESAASAEQAFTLARSLQLPKLTYFVAATLGEAYAAEDNVELAITKLKEAINQVEDCAIR